MDSSPKMTTDPQTDSASFQPPADSPPNATTNALFDLNEDGGDAEAQDFVDPLPRKLSRATKTPSTTISTNILKTTDATTSTKRALVTSSTPPCSSPSSSLSPSSTASWASWLSFSASSPSSTPRQKEKREEEEDEEDEDEEEEFSFLRDSPLMRQVRSLTSFAAHEMSKGNWWRDFRRHTSLRREIRADVREEDVDDAICHVITSRFHDSETPAAFRDAATLRRYDDDLAAIKRKTGDTLWTIKSRTNAFAVNIGGYVHGLFSRSSVGFSNDDDDDDLLTSWKSSECTEANVGEEEEEEEEKELYGGFLEDDAEGGDWTRDDDESRAKFSHFEEGKGEAERRKEGRDEGEEEMKVEEDADDRGETTMNEIKDSEEVKSGAGFDAEGSSDGEWRREDNGYDGGNDDDDDEDDNNNCENGNQVDGGAFLANANVNALSENAGEDLPEDDVCGPKRRFYVKVKKVDREGGPQVGGGKGGGGRQEGAGRRTGGGKEAGGREGGETAPLGPDASKFTKFEDVRVRVNENVQDSFLIAAPSEAEPDRCKTRCDTRCEAGKKSGGGNGCGGVCEGGRKSGKTGVTKCKSVKGNEVSATKGGRGGVGERGRTEMVFPVEISTDKSEEEENFTLDVALGKEISEVTSQFGLPSFTTVCYVTLSPTNWPKEEEEENEDVEKEDKDKKCYGTK